jgi:hypothetical protein
MLLRVQADAAADDRAVERPPRDAKPRAGGCCRRLTPCSCGRCDLLDVVAQPEFSVVVPGRGSRPGRRRTPTCCADRRTLDRALARTSARTRTAAGIDPARPRRSRRRAVAHRRVVIAHVLEPAAQPQRMPAREERQGVGALPRVFRIGAESDRPDRSALLRVADARHVHRGLQILRRSVNRAN